MCQLHKCAGQLSHPSNTCGIYPTISPLTDHLPHGLLSWLGCLSDFPSAKSLDPEAISYLLFLLPQANYTFLFFGFELSFLFTQVARSQKPTDSPTQRLGWPSGLSLIQKNEPSPTPTASLRHQPQFQNPKPSPRLCSSPGITSLWPRGLSPNVAGGQGFTSTL